MTTHAGKGARVPGRIDPHAVTISGIVLDPSYGPGAPSESLRNIERDIPAPGAFPYTRGLFPNGYRSRLWTMRQFAGFGSADDTNKRFKYLLGAAKTSTSANTGLSTAFDLPTLMGRDSDDALSIGEVGKCGVAIDTIEDMHRLYADIPVDQVTVSQTINGPAAVIWALYLAMALQRGIGWDTLGGTLQNDILKEFHAQNEFIYPPEASVKLVVDTIEFQSKFVPKWHSVSISGYHIREAGSTATQELAFTLRDGMEYVEACIERGLDVDQFGPRLSFFFNSHNEFFEEVCKLRAARRIWARAMKHRYGATSEKSWYMKTHVQTAGCSLTEQQPLNNIVRVAYQAMAAVMGGCQSLHTDSMDETLGLPTEQAVTVALRTQQILAHETGVTRVTDPLGGSWFVEALTDKMEEDALAYIVEIDEMGDNVSAPSDANAKQAGAYARRTGFGRGVVGGINRGYFRRKIAEASYRFAEECENKDRIIVGVNEYVERDEKRPIDVLVIPDAVETEQCDRLAAFKKKRGAGAVKRGLDNIRAACQGRAYTLTHDLPGLPREMSPGHAGGLHATNVMPALIDGALCGCTMGEMTAAMADIYGVYAGGPEW
ncbi:MAG: methylmalonyl-CoA mutase family protein [Phycisphaerales bacterium]|jgi:methylmalonyl-CoA mutase N-terminal domain/subunit|nr:methylmalonyl-CoA mutase family protein [Phycisphaerales bacterium]